MSLAVRVRAAAHADCDDVARRRVFDTLGALAAGGAVADHAVLDAFGDRGLLADVRWLCAVARSSEVDDLDRRSCTTPGSVAVLVALAVAAERGLDERAVLAGVVAGYEVMAGVGEARGGPLRLAEGVWPSYELAPLAAAATCAAVLDLDEERTAHALAIAAARVSGRAGRVASEPTSRWLLFGAAAADGVLAALAAEAGAHGDLALLDAFSGPAADAPAGEAGAHGDPARPAAPAGSVWLVERADVKPFCTARQAQSAVEAARQAHAALGRARIAGAVVEVPAAYRAMIDVPEPRTRLASIASAPFQIAAALTDESLLFDVARRSRPALGLPTRVVAADDLTPRYPVAWPARVTLRAADGREATREVAGDDVGWDALEAKHARLGTPPELRAACRSLHPRDLLDIADPQRTVS